MMILIVLVADVIVVLRLMNQLKHRKDGLKQYYHRMKLILYPIKDYHRIQKMFKGIFNLITSYLIIQQDHLIKY